MPSTADDDESGGVDDAAGPLRVPLSGGRRYRSTRLSDVDERAVEWLWPRRWPRGKLVTLDGDPDVGKTAVWCDITARITTGRPLPGEEVAVPPSDVVFMSAEDGLDDTLRPRVRAAGGDLDRVHHFDEAEIVCEGVFTGSFAPVTLPNDVGLLERLVQATGAVLVVVDVLNAFLSPGIKSGDDQSVRHGLAPLKEMAARTGATVLLLRHFPKWTRQGGQAISAGAGSMGIVGISRAGMVAAFDPTDDERRRRVLGRAKGNLTPRWPSLAYRIVCSSCRRSDCDDRSHNGPPLVKWLGESPLTGDQLLTRQESVEDRSALDDLVDWLRDMLSDGPLTKQELLRMAASDGYSPGQLHRARLRAGDVVAERDTTARHRPSVWRLHHARLAGARDTSARDATTSDLGKEQVEGDHARPQTVRASSAKGAQTTPARINRRTRPSRARHPTALQPLPPAAS